MTNIRFTPNDNGHPAGKLCDAALEFTQGELAGMRLEGFAIWERRGGARSVTLPARTYSVNGERRSYALLRVIDPTLSNGGEGIRDFLLQAYAAFEMNRATS